MGKEKEQTTLKTAEKKSGKVPVEDLKTEVGPAVFAGTCAAEGWKIGRQITRREFLAATKRFLQSPISGRTVKSQEEAK